MTASTMETLCLLIVSTPLVLLVIGGFSPVTRRTLTDEATWSDLADLVGGILDLGVTEPATSAAPVTGSGQGATEVTAGGDGNAAALELALAEACCPVCGEGFRDKSSVVLCDTCHTPHHRQCFKWNEKCGMYGCGSRKYLIVRRTDRQTANISDRSKDSGDRRDTVAGGTPAAGRASIPEEIVTAHKGASTGKARRSSTTVKVSSRQRKVVSSDKAVRSRKAYRPASIATFA